MTSAGSRHTGGVDRPPWSDRRRRTLLGLALGAVAFGLGAIALPDQYGLTSAFLAALCAFLLVTAAIVFVAIRGPDTLRTRVSTVPRAGPGLVADVRLRLSTHAEQGWLWTLIAATAVT